MLLLEQRQLIGIGGRNDLRIAAGLADLQAAGDEPGARRDVLRVAELRRRDLLAAKIGCGLQRRIRLNDERRAAIDGAGDDMAFVAVRFEIGVDGRVRADIGEVDRLGEHRLYRARTGIVDVPLDLHAGAKPLFEPAFADAREMVRDQALDMRDIGEVADAQHRLRIGRDGCEHGNGRQRERQAAARHETSAPSSLFVVHDIASFKRERDRTMPGARRARVRNKIRAKQLQAMRPGKYFSRAWRGREAGILCLLLGQSGAGSSGCTGRTCGIHSGAAMTGELQS